MGGGHSVQVGEDFILEMTFENNSEKGEWGASLVLQWLTLALNAGDAGSNPGWGTKLAYIAEKLSLCATTRGPTCCDY